MPAASNDTTRLLSNEIRQIITRKPSWFLRNGMTVFTILVLGLAVATFFVSYPDMIPVKAKLVVVSTAQPLASPHRQVVNCYAETYINKNYVHKIKAGQKVLLKLPLYNGKADEAVEATLDSISNMAGDSGYPAKIIFSKTFTLHESMQMQQLNGLPVQGQVITESVKLSARLLNQFKVFRRNDH